MRPRTTPVPSPMLRRACRAFETWRRTRPARSPIPAPLWALAVARAREAGVSATARQLRVNYAALTQRVQAAGQPGPSQKPGAPAFIEVVTPSLTPAKSVTDCALELTDARGTTLRLTLTSPTLPDLAALAQRLWRARA